MRERVALVFMTVSVAATLALGGAIAYEFAHPGHATALQQQQRRATVPLAGDHEEALRSVPDETSPDPESESAAAEERRALGRLIDALPDEHREVLLLREMEDMSYREIAAVTQVPIGTVMSRLARARAALRGKWLKDTAGEPRAVR